MTPATGSGSPGSHVVPLDGPFMLWRDFVLRGAGFPAAEVERFASPECAAAVEALFEAEGAAEVEGARVVEACDVAAGGVGSPAHDGQRRLRNRLLTCRTAVRRGKAPRRTGDPQVDGEAERYRRALRGVDDARTRFVEDYHAALATAFGRARDTLGWRPFAEALTWQNRAGRRRLAGVLGKPAGERLNGDQRGALSTLAGYLQRYCLKNDTIGFFGPLAWGRVHDGDPALRAEPGADHLAERAVSFEAWMVDVLVGILEEDPAVRPWLVPQLAPLVALPGDRLLLPGGAEVPLSGTEAVVLRCCDGRRDARTIARELERVSGQPGAVAVTVPDGVTGAGAVAGAGAVTEAEVLDVLQRMRERGHLRWTVPVPLRIGPDGYLREWLDRVPAQHAAGVRQALEALEGRRAEVAAAAGDPDGIDEALAAVEREFTARTGRAATRGAGALYASRTLVYEDCVRDTAVGVGSALRSELGPPLALILQSVRWLGLRVAAACRLVLRRCYDRVVASRPGDGPLPLAEVWLQASTLLFGEGSRLLQPAFDEFQRRWAEVLGLPERPEGPVRLSSADLRERVRERFPADTVGWPSLRYCSPDVMIAAPDRAAILAGGYELVLGEVHVGLNTTTSGGFADWHPDRGALLEAVEHDLADAHTTVAPSRQWGHSVLTAPAVPPPTAWQLLVTDDACALPPERGLRLGDVLAELDGDRLVVRRAGSGERHDPVWFLNDLLSPLISDRCQPLAPAPHQPRVQVDKLVIARETWRFTAGELAFSSAADPHDRYLGARRWQRHHALPRRLFVTVPTEGKPLPLDLDSPVSVEIFCHAVRKVAREVAAGERAVGVSEMLPDTGELWLTDAEGRGYTSELRLVTVDQAGRTAGEGTLGGR